MMPRRRRTWTPGKSMAGPVDASAANLARRSHVASLRSSRIAPCSISQRRAENLAIGAGRSASAPAANVSGSVGAISPSRSPIRPAVPAISMSNSARAGRAASQGRNRLRAWRDDALLSSSRQPAPIDVRYDRSVVRRTLSRGWAMISPQCCDVGAMPRSPSAPPPRMSRSSTVSA